MEVCVYGGPPGGGKTVKLIEEMAISPGRYVFALHRVELIDEKMADLKQVAQAARTTPVVVPIHHKTPARKTGVSRAIEEARILYKNEPHVVLLIAHEGMMGADLRHFHGWRIRIDENPGGVKCDAFKAPASGGALADIFELEPDSSEWSKLKVRENGPSKKSVRNDQMTQLVEDMRKCADSPHGALIDVVDWEDLRDSGRTVNWLSVWTPLELEAFDDVVIAAAGYFNSVGHLVAEKLFPGKITYSKRIIAPPERAPRLFKIHYFVAGHRGSTAFWEKDEGKDCLAAVSRHLETVNLGYWSSNRAIDLAFHGRLSGTKVAPKVEGTNSLMQHRSCALIYSSKSQPGDSALIKRVGLTEEQIERAREIEDILQFIMRGAVRDPAFSGDYDVYLYDQHQAEALAEYIKANEIGGVELVPVDEAGIMDVVRENRRKTDEDDLRSKKQRAEDRRKKNTTYRRLKRQQDRQAKINSGTYRRPGRPRKTGS